MAESTRTLRKFKKETLERATAEKKLVDRDRNIIILLNDWFQKSGYCSHAQKCVYTIKQYNHYSQHRFIHTSATCELNQIKSTSLMLFARGEMSQQRHSYLMYMNNRGQGTRTSWCPPCTRRRAWTGTTCPRRGGHGHAVNKASIVSGSFDALAT